MMAAILRRARRPSVAASRRDQHTLWCADGRA
jgi:hypothetical protein